MVTVDVTNCRPTTHALRFTEVTKNAVWWGNINIPFESEKFDTLYNKVVSYLSGKEVFVRDAYACADTKYKTNIRVVNEHAWSNLFAYLKGLCQWVRY